MKHRVLLVLAILLAMALACGPLGGTTEPPSEPEGGEAPQKATLEPTTVVEGGEAAPAEDESFVVDYDALTNLDSYRVRMSYQWTPDSGTAEGWSMEQAYTRDPAAQQWVAVSSTGEQMELVQIGDMSWVCSAGNCIQTQGEDAVSDFGEMAFDLEDFSTDEAVYQGRETVNGVSAKRYMLKLNVVEMMTLTQGEISDVNAECWVADDAGLPELIVRYQASWNESRSGQAGAVQFLYDVYDANVPFTIEPPEGASADLPEDVPTYPDATDLMIMEGMISFSTADEVAVAADFYRTELVTQGWTSVSDDDLGQMVTQTWQKEGRELSVIISAQEGGGSSVLITLSQP